jgi:hypothetical protein
MDKCSVVRSRECPVEDSDLWNVVTVVWRSKKFVRFEVFTAVTMENAVFWDVALCRSCVNRRFGGTYRLHLQGRKIRERGTSCSHLLTLVHYSRIFYPEDGGNTFLRKVFWDKINTAPYSRRRHSSSSNKFDHQIQNPFYKSLKPIICDNMFQESVTEVTNFLI